MHFKKMEWNLWLFSLVFGIIFWFLRITGRVRIIGRNNVKKAVLANRGVIVISNHPSLWEPVLLPFLFFPSLLFSLRCMPYSIADKKNYYDKWWFWVFRSGCLPIERGNPRKELEAVEKTIRPMLKAHHILILFPEGGRTFKRIKTEGAEYSPFGKSIARFSQGIRRIFINMDCLVLPVWVQGTDRVMLNEKGFLKPIPRFWKKIKIIVGEPFGVKNLSKDRIILYLEDTLLELSNQDKSRKRS